MADAMYSCLKRFHFQKNVQLTVEALKKNSQINENRIKNNGSLLK